MRNKSMKNNTGGEKMKILTCRGCKTEFETQEHGAFQFVPMLERTDTAK